MKVTFNPNVFGDKESDGTHCEWFLSEDKTSQSFYTFEPMEELPMNKKGGVREFLTHRFFDDDMFNEHVKDGDITIVEKGGIRYNNKKHDLL